MNRFTRTMQSFVRVPVLAFALCTGAVALGSAATAFAAPAIDGNIDDMITYANGLQSGGTGTGIVVTDKPDVSGNPTPETIYNDLKFIPCLQPQPALGQHWVNGVEIFRHVLAYTPGSTTLYLGLRSEGIIGDGDGNGNPDNAGGGSCNPNDNIEDTTGISGNELYAWSFDLNCDGVTDGQIKIQDNAIVGTGTLAGATGDFKFRAGGIATGTDLELAVTLPAPLPPAFRFVRVEANAFDGLSEDRSDGGVSIAIPNISVSKSAVPTTVCVGKTTRFTITINNTGQAPLSVVAVDQLPAQLSYAGNLQSTCGVGAPVVNGGQLTFPAFNLAAGASCTISFDALASLQCFGEQNNVVDVTGTFSSACIKETGSLIKTAHAEFAVVCQALPCVEVKANGPAAACPGAPVLISGTATNCSQNAEQVVIKVNGVQAYSNSVAGGQTIKWSLKTAMPEVCTAGQNSSFDVEATATTDCGTDTKNTAVLVRCKDKPCLELTANRDPASACPGANVVLSGTVKNCSLDPETIVLTVDGVQAFSQLVQPGATENWSKQVVMPACTGGSSVNFAIHATATGDCLPAVSKDATLTVLCKDKPCVTLTADRNPASACPGDQITVSGTVKNCSLEPETIVVTINGDQAFNQLVQPGATENYTKNYVMPQCTAGAAVDYVVLATATGECPPAATDTKTVSVTCKNPPCVLLTDVVANKQSACPGEAVIVSGKIKNCGTDSATYTATIGGVQVFSGVLAPGAEQSFQREVNMGECVAGNNVTWTVAAHAENSCGQDNKSADASVRCKDKPCVELAADRNPTSACPGDQITISGTVKNCSLDPETIVVTINGDQVFSGVVNAGQTQNYSKQVTMPACTAGQNVNWAIVAIGTNDCDQVGQRKETSVSVLCKSPPCVDLIDVHADKTSACPGAPIHISGTVKNCGTDTADYTVSVGGVQVFSGSLAAGATAPFSRDVNMGECTAGNNVTWTVAAHASNTCGNADKTTDVSVRCNAKPCVELTANPNPTSACPGDAITISGTVKNCSIDAETITVTVAGVQAFNGVVGPGVTQNWTQLVRMPQCTAGQQVPFLVRAVATNDCDQVGDQKELTVNVQCKNPPCVQLVDVQANKNEACPNEAVIISGKVKNCGTDSANYTVTVGGVQVFAGSLEAGATADFNREVNMGECTAGASVPWVVHATASNSCGNADDEKTVSVRCKSKPCVELTASGPESSCQGADITIQGKVHNCSLDSETLVVTVDGVQAFNGPVAGGADANWSLNVKMKACTAGQTVTYAVVATATNGCGVDTKSQPVGVLCLAPPCLNVDLNAPDKACVGSKVQLCGSVTNCSGGTESIEVHYGDQVQRFDNVAPGASKNYCFEVVMAACTAGGSREWTVTAAATNSCGRVEKTAVDQTACFAPSIDVEKTAESQVNDGDVIHYTITVTNKGETDLQDVLITDTMCKSSLYNDHADPAAFSEPAVGANGAVTWKVALLAKGESRTFKFEAKASLAAGGASCPGEVVCTNKVDVVGYCAGSDNSSPVQDSDEVPTTIRCLVFNCPRTPGFWGQQCAQKSGGSTKFTVSQMTAITEKIDDVSSFFNWSAGTDFSKFCAIINPTSPMTSEKQAKRQFASLLANYATDLLDLTPNNGNKLLLDPTTPIHCAGFSARTIGELITEIDQTLTKLANGQPSSATYNDIISCADDINNGRTIPTIAGCEHGDGSVPTSGTIAAGASLGVELYKAMPNPFSSTTQFAYDVTGDNASVDITVFDVAGRQIRKLVNTTQPAGRYTATWDGKSDDGVQVTRGVYFVRTMIAGQKAPVQRLLFIRDGQ